MSRSEVITALGGAVIFLAATSRRLNFPLEAVVRTVSGATRAFRDRFGKAAIAVYS